MNTFSAQQALEKLAQLNPKRKYYAMYSSLLGGIVFDPHGMVVPVDDHIVHRGDGIFEAIKCIGRKIFALDPHLDRLYQSADRVAMKMPVEKSGLRQICIETTQAALNHAKVDSCVLRLFISRGPGNFSPSPYDSIGSQIYLVITPWSPLPAEKYQKGVSVIVSQLEVKSSFFAQVKSCNYLLNVMMKKESVDAGADFAIGIDERGAMAEGPTENIAFINSSDTLCVPDFSRILRGCTLVRIMEYGKKLAPTIRSVESSNWSKQDLLGAKEAFMAGTTLDVLPVTHFTGKPIGSGQPGPISKKLQELLEKDISGSAVLGLPTLAVAIDA